MCGSSAAVCGSCAAEPAHTQRLLLRSSCTAELSRGMFGMLMLAVLTLAVPLPFCFICCWCYAGIRQQEAQAARAQTDGYKLDKNHTFKVSMFDDFDRYAKVPDVYAAPEIKEYSAAVSEGVSGSWV